MEYGWHYRDFGIKIERVEHKRENNNSSYMDAVTFGFEVENVIMPKVTNNTKTFEDVLLAVKSKGLKSNLPKQEAI